MTCAACLRTPIGRRGRACGDQTLSWVLLIAEDPAPFRIRLTRIASNFVETVDCGRINDDGADNEGLYKTRTVGL